MTPTAAVIHVIDDNSGVRCSVEAALETIGWTVRTYPSATAFLQGDLEPGCVVTDINMPGMTGVELVEEVIERALKMPVILMSANPAPRAISDNRLSRVSGFLRKPFDVETLLNAICAATEGSHA